jgi:hypothetical protein
MRSCILGLVVCLAGGSAAYALPAPPVEIAFSAGRVTVSAIDAPVAEVLTEWARKGGAAFAGAEYLGNRRISIRLTNAPEADALQAIVGSAAWFRTEAREIGGAESAFARIVILPAAQTAGGSDGGSRPQADPESLYEYAPATTSIPDDPRMVPPPASENRQPLFPTSVRDPEAIYEYSPTPEPAEPVVSSTVIPPPLPDPETRYEYAPAALESVVLPTGDGIPGLPVFDGFEGLARLPGRVIRYVIDR